MQAGVSCGEIREEGVRIYFPEKVFGKANKHRGEDPSMFDLLAWGADGFERHAFRKDEKFRETAEAYVNMIGKNPWTSESQESYVNYNHNSIEANAEVLGKIQNYISERSPQSPKPKLPSPQKAKNTGKRASERNQNRPAPGHYLSPKVERKTATNETESCANLKGSTGERKAVRKVKAEEGRSERADKCGKEHKRLVNKSYGQILEKTKLEEHEFTEGEQQKLIDKFKQTTRWIPNSAFTTYFGKPPFENYGRGNTHPVDGGLVYGTYLYSHNVHPHRGNNQPKNMQCYPVALSKAKSLGTLVPTYPRTKPDCSAIVGSREMAPKGKIEPELNNFVGALGISSPKMSDMQKFGGKRRSRVTTDC